MLFLISGYIVFSAILQVFLLVSFFYPHFHLSISLSTFKKIKLIFRWRWFHTKSITYVNGIGSNLIICSLTPGEKTGKKFAINSFIYDVKLKLFHQIYAWLFSGLFVYFVYQSFQLRVVVQRVYLFFASRFSWSNLFYFD